jgi:hypothetical protein
MTTGFLCALCVLIFRLDSRHNNLVSSEVADPVFALCAQVDQLMKEMELLRNEAELARAEHENRLADAQAATQRDKAAAEQREAVLQVSCGA